jgi:hypothetical protein
MTGQLTAATAQTQIDDALRAAHEHRLGHATQLDRLGGRWTFRLGRRPGTSVTVAPLATNKLGC